MGDGMSKRAGGPSAESPRSNRSRQLSELLPSVGGAAFRKFGFIQSSIVSRWREIVGEKLAGASMPESIRFPAGKKQDGVLTLIVRGAHAPILSHLAPEIVERVNRFFGYPAIARVTIRQGDLPAAKPRREAPPSIRAVPVELGASLKTIADPELKAVLESLAAGVAAAPALPKVR